jgi:hypothetical protein
MNISFSFESQFVTSYRLVTSFNFDKLSGLRIISVLGFNLGPVQVLRNWKILATLGYLGKS